jgi:hypothetical protein
MRFRANLLMVAVAAEPSRQARIVGIDDILSSSSSSPSRAEAKKKTKVFRLGDGGGDDDVQGRRICSGRGDFIVGQESHLALAQSVKGPAFSCYLFTEKACTTSKALT